MNQQIYQEAKSVASAAQLSHLRNRHQTYFLWQRSRRVKSKSPKWNWGLEKNLLWQPSCRGPAALAALRLSNVGLAICAISDDRAKEQLHALKSFCRALFEALVHENATQTLVLSFQGYESYRLARIIEATGPLWEMHKHCEIVFLVIDEELVSILEQHLEAWNVEAKVHHVSRSSTEFGARFPDEFYYWNSKGPWFLWDEHRKSRPLGGNLLGL